MENHITPPKIQYILQYTDSNNVLQNIDVTPDFSTWDAFETDIVRDDLSGAFIQIQDGGITFTGESFELVRSIYETQGFRAIARLIVNLRKDTFPDLWTYVQKVSLDLNFAKYVRDNTTVSLTANENGLKAMVKANASQKYDIPVTDLNPDTLDYDGLDIKETLSWFPAPITGVPVLTTLTGSVGDTKTFEFAPGIQASDQDVNANYLNYLEQKSQVLSKVYKSTPGSWITTDGYQNWNVTSWVNNLPITGPYFPELILSPGYKGYDLTIKAHLTADFGYPIQNASLYWVEAWVDAPSPGLDLGFNRMKICDLPTSSTGIDTIIDSTIACYPNSQGKYHYLTIVFDRVLASTSEDIVLNKFEFETGGLIQASWTAKVRNNISIPIVSEQKLCQDLINKITGTKYVYKAVVDEHLETIRIAAGESVRNFPKQYVHTSLSDFANYMKSCWGYEYEITNNENLVINTYDFKGVWSVLTPYLKDNAVSFQGSTYAAISDVTGGDYPSGSASWKKITEYIVNGNTYTEYVGGISIIHFAPRDRFFVPETVITIPEINNIKLSVNETYIYTGVKIGIALVQYLSINGTDEFRFLEEWSTGVQNVVNVLDLTSPYRTDSYGFQLLSEKQFVSNSTDDQSDNGIFVLHVKLSGDNYILDRTAVLTGVASPLTMFNAIFSPRQCLIRNKSLLGISTSLLKFTSTAGQADITINGIEEKADISITESLFSPDVLDMDVGQILDLPALQNGLVSCQYRGEQFTGYIKKLSHFWGSDQKTSCTLFLKKLVL